MSKITKLAQINIRKITGGKDAKNVLEEFILKLGHNPDECEKKSTPENTRWELPLKDGQIMEIIGEQLKTSSDGTIYMGVNIAMVPIRGAHDMIAAALELADGLIGIKVSLVGPFLVLSATLGAYGITVEELDYHYRLILAQQEWYRGALLEELGWEELPE